MTNSEDGNEQEIDIRPWIRSELGDLVDEPGVADALDNDNLPHLARLLSKMRRRASTDGKAAIDRVLAERRIFMSPCKPPSRFRFNGFGTTSVGRTDKDPETGTYITTYALSALWIPIIPLKQYVVADAIEGGQYFLGRVPSSRVVKIWRFTAIALILAFVALIGAAVFASQNQSDVWLVNGLPTKVTVEIGEETRLVGPGMRMKLADFPKGECHVIVKVGTSVIDEETITIPGGKDAVVYNVLGAAPLFLYNVVYSESSGNANFTPKTEEKSIDCLGQHFLVRRRVHYVFTPAPETLQLRDDEEERWVLEMGDGAWEMSLALLGNQSKTQEVLDLSKRISLLPGLNDNTRLKALSWYANASTAEESLTLATTLIEQNPQAIQLHRFRQEALNSLGRRDESASIYREFRQAKGDSALTEYLEARALPLSNDPAPTDKLLNKYPDDQYIQVLSIWAYMAQGQWKKALQLIDGVKSPETATTLAAFRSDCLLRLGQRKLAIAAAFDYAQGLEDALDYETSVNWGKLIRAVGGKNPKHPADYFLVKLANNEMTPAIESNFSWRIGDTEGGTHLFDQVKEKEDIDGAKLWRAMYQGPKEAIDVAQKVPLETLTRFDDAALTILAGELIAANQRKTAEQCLNFVRQDGDIVRQLLLDNQPNAYRSNLLSQVRAAVLVVEARRQDAGPAREALLKQATEVETVPGIATFVAKNWK